MKKMSKADWFGVVMCLVVWAINIYFWATMDF